MTVVLVGFGTICHLSCAECQRKNGSPTFRLPFESSWLVTGNLYLYLHSSFDYDSIPLGR